MLEQSFRAAWDSQSVGVLDASILPHITGSIAKNEACSGGLVEGFLKPSLLHQRVTILREPQSHCLLTDKITR